MNKTCTPIPMQATWRGGGEGKGSNSGLGPGGGKQIKSRKTDLVLNQTHSIQRELTPANFRHGNKDS